MALTSLFLGDRTYKKPLVIAGPCSAENEQQVVDTALALADSGAQIFRAGVWKPRTKPGCFEGVGETALPWLNRVKQLTGMPVAVEVATAHHLEAALDAGVDVLWLGARTTGNPFAVQEIADKLAEMSATDVPVLVKNPMHPDIELWIGAIERLRVAGVKYIGAIHRGFSTYGEHFYRNSPQWLIALELRSRCPQLPLLCDPSHIGGRRDLIGPLSQKALDIGFDGLMIECHCNPEAALSDAAQQLTPQDFTDMLMHLNLRDSILPPDSLEQLRKRIDQLDSKLLEVLAQRMEISREIGDYKRQHRMAVLQPDRYARMVDSRVTDGLSLGLNEKFVSTILAAIHEESVRQQLDSN